MIGLLETRLDAVVYRAKFVPTPFAARQLVSHGHVKVNGRRVTVAQLSGEGRRQHRADPQGARHGAGAWKPPRAPERDVPDYVDADHGKMSAKLLRTPKLGDVPYAVQMQPHLIVEFYSR